MNPILKVFQSLGPLSERASKELGQIIVFDTIPQNTELLQIGKRAQSMFFIKNGLARAYYFHDGKEVTDYFAIDGQFIGAVPSLLNGQASHKGIHLIEESEVYYFNVANFETLCKAHHDLEHIARLMSNYALIEEQERIESLRFYSMKERYEMLDKKYPGIMNRCPLHYIASYLGTTQVSISRIRAGTQ